MPAPKTTVNAENFREIYRYLSRALEEERLFDKGFLEQEEAFRLFNQLKLPPDTKTQIEKEDFFKALQVWMDRYVPEDMRKRCLAAVRWKRAKQKHQTKTIRLNYNVYVLLRQYARTRRVTIQQAIYEAILPYVYINPETQVNSVTDETESSEADTPGFKITVF